MSKVLKVTVPVYASFPEGEEAWELFLVRENKIIGKRGSEYRGFDYLTGSNESCTVTDEELKAAQNGKVRRNFWLRTLVKYWKNEASGESVIKAFEADELLDVFDTGSDGRLRLRTVFSDIAQVLEHIIED